MPSDNTSKASEFFESKKEYNDLYPDFLKDKAYDTWYEVPYYGKVDTLGNLVLPRENIVIENIDEKGDARAINFVSDAFLGLQNFIRMAKMKGAFKSSFFGEFDAKKAYEPLPVLFDDYFENYIFDPFLNNYISNKNIPNFKCFVKEYLNFARAVSKDGALTMAGFMLSNNCTNKISGLIIDLTNDDHDDFNTKVDDFLKDPDYLKLTNVCENHGFKINKNAPWQLMADLSNGQMQNRANKYDIDLRDNSFFDNYYLQASAIDYYNFKSYLWQMYSEWYAVNSTYSKIQVKVKFNGFSPMFSHFETLKINELPVEPSDEKNAFWAKYGELYFLKVYFRTRLIECGRENMYKQLEKYLFNYYNIGGISLALRFVDIKINKSAIYTSNEHNPYYFQLDKEKNKSIMETENIGTYAYEASSGLSGY